MPDQPSDETMVSGASVIAFVLAVAATLREIESSFPETYDQIRPDSLLERALDEALSGLSLHGHEQDDLKYLQEQLQDALKHPGTSFLGPPKGSSH